MIFIFYQKDLINIFFQKNSEEELKKILLSQFDNNYQVKNYQIGNYQMIFANSSFNMNCDQNSILIKKASPLIIIRSIKDNKIVDIYELNFWNKEILEKGNNISFLNFYFPENGQKDFLFGIEAMIDWCGSDGIKGLALFKLKNNQIQPPIGYPFDSDTGIEFILIDKAKNISYRLKTVRYSSYTKMIDLNKDMKIELLYGEYLWNPFEESHYDEHYWNLSVYQLENDSFKPARWWNNGFIYKTETKITNVDQEIYEKELMRIFFKKK